MSDRASSRGRLTAWQRWEMPDLVSNRVTPHESAVLPPVPQEPAATVQLPTAAQVEQLHQEARDEGFREGYQAGMQQAAEQAQVISDVMDSLSQQVRLVDQKVMHAMLDLSVELARQMVRQALSVKPEIVLGVIREALDSFPVFNQTAHLVLHPEDAALLRTAMGEQLAHSGWKIHEDVRVERGGCRLETAHSQVDATVAKRWQHLMTALGQQDHAWVEP